MSGPQYAESQAGGPLLVFLTPRRIRYLGMIIAVGCFLMGSILFLLPPTDWRHRHLPTYASFLFLPATGIITVLFSRVMDIGCIIRNARMAGYEASEEEKRLEEESIQEMGTLYLLIPLAYTIASLLLVYFVFEPSGVITNEVVYLLYFGFVWLIPMLLVILMVIPYYNYRRYPMLRVFWHKSMVGGMLLRRKPGMEVGKPGDLRILNEDKSKENQED